MQVILLERVGRLGGIGDEVRVKDGFARNFLLPQGKALRATDENRKRFERERHVLEQRNAERRDAARGDADKLEGASFVLIRQAGESGQLYGSVTARDVAEAAVAGGHQVVRSQVSLDQAIKSIGLYKVKVRLHAEVAVEVTVNVARTADEAERQARGEDVIQSQAEEDRAVAEAQAIELFEAGAAPELGEESVPSSESNKAGA
jgi:large subunit ribosomal protein L9